MAATAWMIERTGESFGQAGGGSAGTGNSLRISFRIRHTGPTHVAGILSTGDDWKTNQVIEGKFLTHTGTYGEPGSEEQWEVVASNITRPFEYILFCHDHKGVTGRQAIYDSNEGECYRFE